MLYVFSVDEHMVLASGRLLIGAVRSRDAGRYRCSAYNDVMDSRAWSPTTYRLRVVDGTPHGQSTLATTNVAFTLDVLWPACEPNTTDTVDDALLQQSPLPI